jgi:hypothetical protein
MVNGDFLVKKGEKQKDAPRIIRLSLSSFNNDQRFDMRLHR